MANIFAAASAYGAPSTGPWLTVALRVLFWIYVAVSFLVAIGLYYHLFTAKPGELTVQSMTPSWILPIFPAFVAHMIVLSQMPADACQTACSPAHSPAP